MTAYLKDDIKSNFRKDRKEVIYGLKGEKVTIISDSGNVLIVEGKSGKRFPVKENLITKTN